MKKTILTLWLSVSLILHAHAQQYGLLRTIGTTVPSAANGLFSNPRGIDSDAQYNLYVADVANNRIQKFDSAGNFLLAWGTTGSGNGQFNSPAFVSVDPVGGFIYVTDIGNYRIQKFDLSGNFLQTWGSQGTSASQFHGFPVGITACGLSVFVIDYSGDTIRVKKFTNTGVFLLQWKELVGVINPEGISSDSQGNICIVYSSGIRRYTQNGVFINNWTGSFTNAWSLSLDVNDNYYITDQQHSNGLVRFQKFNSAGVYDTFSDYTCNNCTNGFTAVEASLNGYVYVSDNASNVIRVYSTGAPYIPFVPVAAGISSSYPAGAIKIFPNPTVSETNLFVSDQSETVKVVVYSVTGNVVYENYSVPSNVNFTLPDFASGIYAVVVTGSKGIATKKLVKL
jgi:hypothetical protein